MRCLANYTMVRGRLLRLSPKLLLQEAVTLFYYDRSRDRSAKKLVVVGVPNIEHDAVLVAPPYLGEEAFYQW